MNEKIEEHYHRFFGRHRSSNVDLSPNHPVDLLVFPPTPDRPIYTIATRGLSSVPQETPPGMEKYRHLELLIYLPEQWNVDLEKKGEPAVWAAALLKFSARYMIDKKVFMGPGSVMHTEDNRHPTFFRYPYALYVPPLTEDPEFFPLKVDGKTIEFCALMLVTEEEAEFMKKNGFRALIDAMEKRETFDPIMQPSRPCTFETESEKQEKAERMKLVDEILNEEEFREDAAPRRGKAPARKITAKSKSEGASNEMPPAVKKAFNLGCTASTMLFLILTFYVGSNSYEPFAKTLPRWIAMIGAFAMWIGVPFLAMMIAGRRKV